MRSHKLFSYSTFRQSDEFQSRQISLHGARCWRGMRIRDAVEHRDRKLNSGGGADGGGGGGCGKFGTKSASPPLSIPARLEGVTRAGVGGGGSGGNGRA